MSLSGRGGPLDWTLQLQFDDGVWTCMMRCVCWDGTLEPRGLLYYLRVIESIDYLRGIRAWGRSFNWGTLSCMVGSWDVPRR